MKLNWAERLAVNNPARPIQQKLEIRWMKKHRTLAPGSAILEVGCGRGAGAALIRGEFRPSSLQAMDLDLRMIRGARKYLSPDRRTGVSFFAGDALRLPCKDETFDAVFGFGVLHHVPDWQGALGELARVLKPGGVYFLEELYPSLYQNFLTKHILLHPRENRFRSGDLKRALKDAGLDLGHLLEFSRVGILGISTKKSISQMGRMARS